MRRSIFAGLATIAISLIASVPSAPAQGVSEATCPGSFEVLHHDSIGRLTLAPGPYTITLVNATTLTCADASELFRQFLEDYDGQLHGGWVLDPTAATFTRGLTGVGFRVAPAAGPPGPTSRRVCPSYFT
ncbi:MAG TPA: hypothetical protein VFQ12_08405, partial [Thermoleophilaceae bacterium]|nr:hypothetical protein [Thermoleophilaceae bacterium]